MCNLWQCYNIKHYNDPLDLVDIKTKNINIEVNSDWLKSDENNNKDKNMFIPSCNMLENVWSSQMITIFKFLIFPQCFLHFL